MALDALPTIDTSIITATSRKRPVCFVESRGNGKHRANAARWEKESDGKRKRERERERRNFGNVALADSSFKDNTRKDD